ncbi:Tfp pilus assembly protein PilX [Ectothiorhodospira sp. PHS-1]|uniref:pilus assembly PilX family protein n=1 Tax=Ectothiorhodospira sp. PHS-1 TaxID=519989 RepID=UPI00024A8AC9|nr:PilX N-terminal domain-containing pilus assembly protein [Ectothiorhodospira sp. PHS-1]EHQ53727.1 Tfp pilus assembly protein PilX [Ectothiorhodospira sp. PHS-1]
MTHPPRHGLVNAQTGSALIIALIFLLLITMIGVTAMQSTTMQERMAGNLRDGYLAFEAAEAALREGETWLDNGNNMLTADVTAALVNPAQWDGINPSPTGTAPLGNPDLSDNPVFHVSAPRLVRVNPADPTAGVRSIYPIITRGQGGTAASVVVLQSHCTLPCRP